MDVQIEWKEVNEDFFLECEHDSCVEMSVMERE